MQFNPRIQPQLPSGRMAGVLATVLLIFALAPSARANPQASPEPEEARPPVIARHALPESDANQAEPSENFASLEEALVWLSHANEQDKSTDEIRKKLIARPLAHHSASSEIDDTPQLQSGDYDGDGARDLVVVLRDFCAADCPAQGPNWRGFIIWGDRTWSELLTGEAAEPRAVALLPQGDLTGDGFPDIALSRETCGAHTCFKDARIFSVASTTRSPRRSDLSLIARSKAIWRPQRSRFERAKSPPKSSFQAAKSARRARAPSSETQALPIPGIHNPRNLTPAKGSGRRRIFACTASRMRSIFGRTKSQTRPGKPFKKSSIRPPLKTCRARANKTPRSPINFGASSARPRASSLACSPPRRTTRRKWRVFWKNSRPTRPKVRRLPPFANSRAPGKPTAIETSPVAAPPPNSPRNPTTPGCSTRFNLAIMRP